MIERRVALGLLGLLATSACASSPFVSSWKSPTAKPLVMGSDTKVAAVVMMGDESSRKSAEDKLASEISARGWKGVPMYQIMPAGTPGDEAAAREALVKADVKGAVVIRPTADASGKTVDYSVPPYSNYWDSGFYAHGWGKPWIDPTGVAYDTIVSVDTLIYSLTQNQLVWAGKSKKTNPATLNELVGEVAADTAVELKELALVK